jgi:hypothetical protein
MKSNLNMLASAAALAVAVVASCSPAFAYSHKVERATHAQHASRNFGQAYGYVPKRAAPSSRDIYESYSLGHQSFSNPDRDFWGPYGHINYP